MELLWKAITGTLLAVILGLTLNKNEKDIGVLLTLAVCCMGIAIAVSYLEPVIDFLHHLESLAQLQANMLGTLLKVVGISLSCEIVSLICTDVGNSSMGKMLQILGVSAILYLSLPIFTAMLNMIQQILGEL